MSRDDYIGEVWIQAENMHRVCKSCRQTRENEQKRVNKRKCKTNVVSNFSVFISIHASPHSWT